MIELMKLPYAEDALEPFLSKEIVHYHYDKHHRGYVDNLNKLIKGTTLEDKTLEVIIKAKSEGPVFNNASQVWNHNFYWNSLTAAPKEKAFDPESKIGKALVAKFKTFDDFKTKFTDVAKKCFGSGWVWLVLTDGELEIRSTKNAHNFVSDEKVKPLLVCDVWEHSYYLEYKNDREKYVKAFFDYINWDFASIHFEAPK
jgi:Fe-Mn family superoxide dismutase